jgi:hypothetical protein
MTDEYDESRRRSNKADRDSRAVEDSGESRSDTGGDTGQDDGVGNASVSEAPPRDTAYTTTHGVPDRHDYVAVNLPVVVVDELQDLVTVTANPTTSVTDVVETDTGCWMSGDVARMLFSNGVYELGSPINGTDRSEAQFTIHHVTDTDAGDDDADRGGPSDRDSPDSRDRDDRVLEQHGSSDSDSDVASARAEATPGDAVDTDVIPVVVRVTGVPGWEQDVAVTFRDSNDEVLGEIVGSTAGPGEISLISVLLPRGNEITGSVTIHATDRVDAVTGRVELMTLSTAIELVKRAATQLHGPTVYLNGEALSLPVLDSSVESEREARHGNGCENGVTGRDGSRDGVVTPGASRPPRTGVTPHTHVEERTGDVESRAHRNAVENRYQDYVSQPSRKESREGEGEE